MKIIEGSILLVTAWRLVGHPCKAAQALTVKYPTLETVWSVLNWYTRTYSNDINMIIAVSMSHSSKLLILFTPLDTIQV